MSFESPAAIFVMQLIPATFMPACFAAITSITVLIPTASAPSFESIRISAGDSNDGPVTCAYIPDFNFILFLVAAFLILLFKILS